MKLTEKQIKSQIKANQEHNSEAIIFRKDGLLIRVDAYILSTGAPYVCIDEVIMDGHYVLFDVSDHEYIIHGDFKKAAEFMTGAIHHFEELYEAHIKKPCRHGR